MKKVILESPYAGDIETNLTYARKCMADCFKRNEAPFASHLIYTQEGILDDTVYKDRMLGIEAGLLWGAKADYTVVYTDLGISDGMMLGIRNAKMAGRKIEYRTIL